MTKKNGKNEIKLTNEDLVFIYGDDYPKFLEIFITNCFCNFCQPPAKYNSTIVDYEIFLNDLDDVILRGFCAVCKNPVGRYLETGEVAIFEKRIKSVRKRYKK